MAEATLPTYVWCLCCMPASVLTQPLPPSPFRYSDPSKWTAFLGLLDQGQRTATGVQEHELRRIISHPSFNDFTFDYDIALLELKKPAEYSATVRPICLPDTTHVFPAGKAIWVTGWGHTQEGGEFHTGPGACVFPEGSLWPACGRHGETRCNTNNTLPKLLWQIEKK